MEEQNLSKAEEESKLWFACADCNFLFDKDGYSIMTAPSGSGVYVCQKCWTSNKRKVYKEDSVK